jgi:hypothetical protein
MQALHPTFVLHNGIFRIDTVPLKPMLTLDHADKGALKAAS